MINAKRKAVLERLMSLEKNIRMATEYLESGKHANSIKFRPLLAGKFKYGKELPPHKDWVKNVFLPQMEKAQHKAERLLDRLGKG